MLVFDVTLDEAIDPRAYLEQFIVDNTCEWCGQTVLPYTICEEGKKRYVPAVQRLIIVRKEWKNGYWLEHRRYWRVCVSCRNKQDGGFASFVFPVIRTMAQQPDLIDQLLPVQPMGLPNAGIMYMDYVYERRREGPRREEPLPRQAEPHNDMKDAVAAALLAYHTEKFNNAVRAGAEPRSWKAFAQRLPRREDNLRGRLAHAFTLDDANWRLEVDDAQVNGDEATVDARITLSQTLERIEVNFTVKDDGTHFNTGAAD